MFELDVPTKGVELIEDYKKVLFEDLKNSSDYTKLKASYQEQIDRLVDRVEVPHHIAFMNTYLAIDKHFYECGYDFFEEPYKSNKALSRIDKGLKLIKEAEEYLKDIYEKPKNLNYPHKELKTVFENIDSISPITRHSIDLETGEKTLVNMPHFKKSIIFKNLRALSSILETLYKERVKMEALTHVLDFTPKQKKGETSVSDKRKKSVENLVHKLKDDHLKENGKPYFQSLDIEISKELKIKPQAVRKYRSQLGLTDHNWPF